MIDHRLIKTVNYVLSIFPKREPSGGFPDYDACPTERGVSEEAEFEMTFTKGYRNWVSVACLRK
jgi:hypothetical protein